MRRLVLSGFLILTLSARGGAQVPPPTPLGAPNAPARIEKLGPGLYRLGKVRVDTNKREVSVPGRLNKVAVLEFIANTPGGFKAYESAMTLEANAVTFNAALLLIGLDKARARVPRHHFDEIPPEGDQVELWFETAGPTPARHRIEQLLLDQRSNQTLPEGPWVYTGSTIMPDGQYAAAVDGVLIGFVHSPSPIIENPRAAGINAYGSIVLNPKLGLAPEAPITLIVRAIGRGSPKLP